MIHPKDEDIEALLGERAFKAPKLKCGLGHIVRLYCSNDGCNNDALCCNEEEECKNCSAQHKDCSFKKMSELNKQV